MSSETSYQKRLQGSHDTRIRVQNLEKTFRSRGSEIVALEDVSFTVPDGCFLSIVGPSGCGKTTLLRILGGLEDRSSGTVEIAHRNQDQPLTSMIFQEQSVFPWLTVRENIAYGLRLRGIDRQQREAVVEDFLVKVGLSKFGDNYPHQLSGGMKQRVSVARAFANDPEILLMDEPFAALDEQNKILLQEELLDIWQGTNKTVVYVTHSIDEALILSDRVMVMTAHPGQVKTMVENDLPRNLSVTEIKADPRFSELYSEIWQNLRDEVLRGQREAGIDIDD